MRVACVTKQALLEERSWAKAWPGLGGAAFHLARALQRLSFELDFVGPLTERRVPFSRLKSAAYGRLWRKRYYPWAEESVFRGYAHQVAGAVSRLDAEVVLCPENAMPIAYLECPQPIVLWTDAPFAALIDHYDYLSHLCDETRDALRRMEASALRRCARVLYSSEWAAEAARRQYEIDAAKVCVVPWGANLVRAPTAAEVRAAVERRAARPCKLLFAGMWWGRKGGDTAVAVAGRLNAAGIAAELTVVGCEPSRRDPLPSFVNVVGFLDKSTREGRERLEGLFLESHFLLLPTRADCTPLVIAEASAFGVPSLATNVGGMAELVKDDRNGRLFASGAGAAEYCDYIAALLADGARYRDLALSSFREFEERMNWDAAARAVAGILDEVARGRGAR